MPTVTASSVTETASASIQEKSKITSDDSSIVVQSTVEATSTTTNETNTSTKTDASVTTTATTTQSTTTSSTSTTVSTKSTPEIIDITASSNTSTSPAGSSVHPASRPLERAGSGCNDGYFIDDRSEININFQKYRMVFVVNKDAVFYKKNAFRQAKLVSSTKSISIDVTLFHKKNFFIFTLDACNRNEINVEEIPQVRLKMV